MDNITHIVLGGGLAHVCFAPRLGRLAFVAGAIAATLPDLDVFIHTGDQLRDHLMHRHFTHSLLFVPILGLITTVLLMTFRRARPHGKTIFLAATLAGVTHTLLDAATSWGTMLLWPFSDSRISWDWIAVIDPLFTLPLLIGVWIGVKRRARRPAAIGLAIALAYMGLAVVQHARAAGAQRQLMAMRGHTANLTTPPRVMPQLGSIVVYRSIYEHEARFRADGIRLGPLSAPAVMAGGSLPRATVEDVRPFPAPVETADAFDSVAWFAQGYLARSPHDPLTFGDMRYSSELNGFAPLWGVQLEETQRPQWRSFTGDLRRGAIARLLRYNVSGKHFVPLGDATNGRLTAEHTAR